MRNAATLATRLAVLSCTLAAIACSSDPAPASTADAAVSAADTSTTFDSANNTDTKTDTAVGDASKSDAAATDSAGSDTSATDAVAADAEAKDTAVADTAAVDTSVTDTGAADTAISDASATDTAATDTAATDTAATDTLATDTAVADSGPAACTAGALKRCWVECPEAYASGCINAGLPVLIMGTQACSGGQWQPCATNTVCSEVQGTCANSTKAPATVLCTDGVSKNVGGYLCLKPIGAQCAVSYYSSWPMADCPDLCSGPDDVCTTAGEKRDCTATCGSLSGPTVKGTQNCNDYCNGKFWGPCLSDDACLKLAK